MSQTVRRSRMLLASAWLALALGGCMSDPIGVGDLTLVVEGTSGDSVWVAVPGADTIVRVRLYDLEGNPVSGAEVSWTPSGTGSNVSTSSMRSDRQGDAVARWRIGTDASEQQELRLTARHAGAMREMVIRGRVVPKVVATLRAGEGPLVARLGDTLTLDIVAIDPFGNHFAPPQFAITVTDSTIASLTGAARVTGLRRGRTALHVTSAGTATEFSLDVVQRVAAIEVAADTVRFTSLQAEWPIAYVLRDDRGLVVSDTFPAAEMLDTTVARWVDGRVRAEAPGLTELRLALGTAAVRLPVNVTQRIFSLRLIRDTVRFDALTDTTTLRPVAYDSLGSRVRNPRLEYQVAGDTIVRISGGRQLEAVRPGSAVVTVSDPETGLTASVEVVVQQRVVSVDLPAAPLVFEALGDADIIIAGARDRLGAAVSGAVLEYAVTDSLVAALDSGTNRVRAIGPGLTTLTVREPESGLEASRAIRVEQIATTLAVAVLHDGDVIALPTGSALALECSAADRNGYAIAQGPRLVRAVRRTVSGTGCADAVIQRSGYDTLVFAMGTAEALVPVIVATRPDSVGVLVTANLPSSDLRTRFEGEDFTNPLLLALRPMVADIMSAYGNPTSPLDRARALRDWVARTAIHPDQTLHPSGSTANLSVLPPNKTWADVNALRALPTKESEDRAFWDNAHYDGYVMLDRLLGTLDVVTGARADDGLMVHVSGARYRIRDIASYRYALCSYQAIILSALWAADGLHGFRIAMEGHDPAAVFIADLGWVYQDPTFNEEYLLGGAGQPLSPVALLDISSAGQAGRLRAVKPVGPDFDPEPYVPQTRTYLSAGHPDGMRIMGGQLQARVVGRQARWGPRYVQIDVPALATMPAPWSDESIYRRVTPDIAFPRLGPVVTQVRLEDSVHVVQLASAYPNHQRFERRISGQAWEPAGATDVLPVGACRVEYRSVDAAGAVSAVAEVDVWAPRAEAFLRSAFPGSLRAQASLCVTPPIQ